MQTLHTKSLILCGIAMSAFVRKGNFSMSALKIKCRHADIKICKVTTINTTLTVSIILYTQQTYY